FSEKRKTPAIIQYLGEKLPAAIFGMLVVYCLRNVNIMQGNHGIPEAFSIIVTIILHLWRKQLLLSIAGGTATYMLFIQFLS
ncbi:MAG: AzlD domain-containing protein, partial [Eubacterium sp.]|nr:AzlD domain-containing protein [Eubacterium sp.]